MEWIANNTNDFFVSLLASLIVAVSIPQLNKLFSYIYKNNKIDKFNSDYITELERIVRNSINDLTSKRVVRLFRVIRMDNKINFPIKFDKRKISDIIYVKLLKDKDAIAADNIAEKVEIILEESEDNIAKINSDALHMAKKETLPIFSLIIIFAFGYILLSLGIFFILTS